MSNSPVDEMAEIDNALAAAADLARHRQTERRCLACAGALVVDRSGSSYAVRCANENRVIFASRGI